MLTPRLAAFALILLTALTRLPALVHPLAIDDEAIYSVVANEIVDGGKPYIDAVERKPPLLFYTYAAVFGVAGKYNWPALHLVALLWTLATMAGLFVIGRALFDTRTGLIAGLLYSLFQPAINYQNLGFNGELLMNLPIVWAWAIAFSSRKSKAVPILFAAGVLSCVAFLLKQPAAIAAVPLGIYLLLPSYRSSRDLTISDSFFRFVIFVAGFWLTLGLAVLVLQQQGILEDAFYWTIKDHASPHFFVGRFIRGTRAFVLACLPLLFAVVCAREVWKTKPAEWRALLLFTVASAIGACAGGRFYPHYYIQLLPPLALLAAPVFARSWVRASDAKCRWLLHPALVGIWIVLTLLVFPIAKWHELAARRQPTEAGRYLSEHHLPSDRLFVWGQVARIYLEARMRPACRYVTTFPLTGYIFGGPIPGLDTHDRILPGAWETLERDFAQHPPRYIVDVQNDGLDYTADYKIADFPILQNLIDNEYELAVRTTEGVIYKRRTR